ncbi:MAG: N-formylglutamate amidohydrolase [Actinomycetota bacterium]|nr:N-formylglutamate amidohydrolase [Actinomycetota bacterium]MDP2288491.1 N-formylglutamate amidohydrolase [Actinomycetota bacterium]
MPNQSVQDDASFQIIPGDATSRVIVHVPHASTVIPEWVRQRIVLSDRELSEELSLMTDARTDEIALLAASDSHIRPWIFVNQHSRLVVDPERFKDPGKERMAAPEIGMGAVYTRTAHGQELRATDGDHHKQLINTYFDPYSNALQELVAQRLAAVPEVTIVDLHSFPQIALPYELLVKPSAHRPELCIGTDDCHTPPWLRNAVADSFAELGESRLNEPFGETYVPMSYWHKEPSVHSVMVELRRDTYLATVGGISRVAKMLTTLLNSIEAHT